MAEAHYTSAL